MSLRFMLIYLFFAYLPSQAQSQTSLLSPIQKDPTTLLYTLTVYLKTPLQPTKLHLDLGSSFSWLDCSNYNNSTSYHYIPCGSSLCTSFNSFACSNDSCSLYPENPITRRATVGTAIVDSLALPITTADGSPPTQLGLVPEFLLSCCSAFLLNGLAKGATGLVALGWSNHSLPAQVSDALSSPRYFALCLSGSQTEPGVAFLGTRGPYFFLLPNNDKVDLSQSLVYTPLILNPVGNTVISYYQQPSDEYYINLTSIKVNGKVVQFNDSLLAVDENGFGGTKISTVSPYTSLERSIYKAVLEAFVNESSGLNLTVTSAVEPFDVCYPAGDVLSTRVGPGVPTIDLVMESEDVFWRIFGANSMVRVVDNGVDVWCLGFVDGGVNPRTSIVIGGHQMEDNVLQFDLESKRLGFSSSVLLKRTTCGDFNFGSYSKY